MTYKPGNEYPRKLAVDRCIKKVVKHVLVVLILEKKLILILADKSRLNILQSIF